MKEKKEESFSVWGFWNPIQVKPFLPQVWEVIFGYITQVFRVNFSMCAFLPLNWDVGTYIILFQNIYKL